VRYDAGRVELSNVIVPPYDVIAADERESFYERDPHNAIRFELTRKVADEATTDYAEVGETLVAWLRSGVLIRDERPAYYVMRQRFVAPSGETLERMGFFAAGVVLPHERTLAGPKADRLKVMRASRANLSSVFLLYQDREQWLGAALESAFDPERGELLGSARDDAGVEYQLAALREPEAVARVERFMAERPVVIADGHHRYETALAYRDEQRAAQGVSSAAGCESTLAYFANAYAPGSLLLPIHRVIRKQSAPTDAAWLERLPDWDERSVSIGSVDDIAELLETHLAPLAGHPAFAADDATGTLRIFSRPEPLGDALMVRTLEREVIGSVFELDEDAIRDGAVSFPKSAERAAREVRAGDGTVALYLNPLTPDDVFRVTGEGVVMPQKSTFFYPKVPTGLVFRTHDAGLAA
jgi:uncharacterized protein (DUF1015 family)